MVAASDRQSPTNANSPPMRVSWFFDAGFHVEIGDAEAYNLETWTDVRRWLGSHGRPILPDPRDVLMRLYNSEINGYLAEVPGGGYVVALGDEHNGLDAEGLAPTWDGALRWLEQRASVYYSESVFATNMSSRSN